MNKEEFIRRRGITAYTKKVEQSNAWHKAHTAEDIESRRAYREAFSEKMREYKTGVRHERHKVRMKHGSKWRKYKTIIAPGLQIQHEWIPDTANYTGVALVEADQHMLGVINVIKILNGKITMLTEEEVGMQ